MVAPVALQAAVRKPDAPPASRDVNALVREGFARIQALAGDEWTDFNAHDPGVTILETLCFALTDIAYRAGHPIRQIIASSSGSTGCPLDSQPLFTGDQALTTAPVNDADFRKLLSFAAPEIKNVWLRPSGAAGAAAAVQDILVQFHPEAARGERAAALSEVDAAAAAVRPMGVDLNPSREVAEAVVALTCVIDLAPGADPEETIARALFDIERSFNPSPTTENTEAAIMRGVSPAEVFDGPLLQYGAVSDDSLQPLTSRLDSVLVRRVIARAAGVSAVTDVMVTSPAAPDGPYVAVVDHSRAGLSGIRAKRGGRPVALNADRIADHLGGLIEHRRLELGYQANRVRSSEYARRRPAPADRRLARYRSIQRLFPEAYGIGEFGAGGDLGLVFEDGEAGRKSRSAYARQLKAYLLLFEQVLADSLSQLDHAAPLLSFAPLDRSYFPQSLAGPEDGDPDAPPDIGPVLGAAPDGGEAWRARYADGIEAISRRFDPFLDRRRRALDHMLARFGQSVADAEATERGVEARRQLLAEVIPLGRDRALGFNILKRPNRCADEPAKTAAERLIHLKSGMTVRADIVEHVLLRNVRRGIGALQIDRDFRITRPEAVAIAVADMARPIHAVVGLAAEPDGPMRLEPFVAAAIAGGSFETLRQPVGYQTTLRLTRDGIVRIEFIEQFASESDARRVAAALKRGAEARVRNEHGFTLRRSMAPFSLYDEGEDPGASGFAASGVSVFLRAAPGAEGLPAQDLPDPVAIADAVLPAALNAGRYWLAGPETAAFDAAIARWREALAAARAAPDNPAFGTAAAEAAAPVVDFIRDEFCRDLFEKRGFL